MPGDALYIDVFVDPNPNTPEGCGLRFKAHEGPARPISQVQYEGAACAVVGWSSANGGSPVPAQVVLVEDSSAGTAALVFGGDWGLRITPPTGTAFGEPYLLLDASAMQPL